MKFRGWVSRIKWRSLEADPRVRRWAAILLMVFTVGFLLFLLIRGRRELAQFDDWDAYLLVCAQGFLIYPLSLVVQAGCWATMIARFGNVKWGWRDAEIYATTHLMRRLPGAVWYLAGRTMIYRSQGIGARVTLAASGLEWGLLFLMALLLYLVLSLAQSMPLWVWIPAALLLGICCLWALRYLFSIQGYQRLPRFIHRRLGALPSVSMPRLGDIAIWMAGYLFAYLIGGWILFFLVKGVAPEAGLNWVDTTRIWSLTGGVGFLASMIIPAGLGVRELTLTALLSPAVPTVGALLIAILLRMLFIVSDLVWGGLIWSLARVLGARKTPGAELATEASNRPDGDNDTPLPTN